MDRKYQNLGKGLIKLGAHRHLVNKLQVTAFLQMSPKQFLHAYWGSISVVIESHRGKHYRIICVDSCNIPDAEGRYEVDEITAEMVYDAVFRCEDPPLRAEVIEVIVKVSLALDVINQYDGSITFSSISTHPDDVLLGRRFIIIASKSSVVLSRSDHGDLCSVTVKRQFPVFGRRQLTHHHLFELLEKAYPLALMSREVLERRHG